MVKRSHAYEAGHLLTGSQVSRLLRPRSLPKVRLLLQSMMASGKLQTRQAYAGQIAQVYIYIGSGYTSRSIYIAYLDW